MISADEVRALLAKVSGGWAPGKVHMKVLCESYVELSDKFHDCSVRMENVKAELAQHKKDEQQ